MQNQFNFDKNPNNSDILISFPLLINTYVKIKHIKLIRYKINITSYEDWLVQYMCKCIYEFLVYNIFIIYKVGTVVTT